LSKIRIGTKQVRSNILYSVLAQFISLLVSVVISLIVPKYISEIQYAYWQTYVLYVGFVGVLHFGLLDGIILRYSQYDYEELDKEVLRSQFKILLFVSGFFVILVVSISSILMNGAYHIVAVLVAIGIIIKNQVTYTSYTFQITNRINKYVILTIVQRASFGIISIVLLLISVDNFYWFCLAELLSDVIAIIVGASLNKGLYFGKTISIKNTLNETWENVSAGFLLLIANWASMLLIGGARMVIQFRWDDLVFGKISFSFSISSIFLTFVNTVSVVLFPALKRMNPDELPSLYRKIRNSLSPMLFLFMLFYYPGCWVLEKWLPAYKPSLIYLGLLLPIIIFTSKVSLLTNNYLKAYRKEKTLLLINVLTVVLSFVLYLFSAYILNNLSVMLLCVVLIVILRSVFSEIVVMRLIKTEFWRDFAIELFMTIMFVVSTMYFSRGLGFGIYSATLIVYLFIYRKNFRLLNKIKNGN
jgi:O-antigen/teichoic acid export membrane protein